MNLFVWTPLSGVLLIVCFPWCPAFPCQKIYVSVGTNLDVMFWLTDNGFGIYSSGQIRNSPAVMYEFLKGANVYKYI
jgi:hypothetical protein